LGGSRASGSGEVVELGVSRVEFDQSRLEIEFAES